MRLGIAGPFSHQLRGLHSGAAVFSFAYVTGFLDLFPDHLEVRHIGVMWDCRTDHSRSAALTMATMASTSDVIYTYIGVQGTSTVSGEP